MTHARSLIAFALVAALLSGCGNSDDSSEAPRDREMSQETCDLVDENLRLSETLENPFDLSEAEIDDLFRDRVRVLEDMAESVDEPDVRESVNTLARLRAVSDALLHRELRTNRDALARIGVSWTFVVANSPKASEAERDAYLEARESVWGLGFVATACTAPDQLEPVVQDLDDHDPKVDSGTILYVPLASSYDSLDAISTDRQRTGSIAPPPGWDQIDSHSVAPDGRTITAVVRRLSVDPAVGIAQRTFEGGWTVIYSQSDKDIACPTASTTGVVTATLLGSGGEPNMLLAISDGTERIVPLPLADFYCGGYLPDGGLVLGVAQTDRRVPGEVVHVDDTGAIRTLLRNERCTSLYSGTTPDQSEVLVIRTCPDASDSGLVAVNIATGDTHQILAGSVALSSASPSGNWFAVGLRTSLKGPSALHVNVWLVRRDGSGLRQLTDSSSSFPVWVADDLGDLG